MLSKIPFLFAHQFRFRKDWEDLAPLSERFSQKLTDGGKLNRRPNRCNESATSLHNSYAIMFRVLRGRPPISSSIQTTDGRATSPSSAVWAALRSRRPAAHGTDDIPMALSHRSPAAAAVGQDRTEAIPKAALSSNRHSPGI